MNGTFKNQHQTILLSRVVTGNFASFSGVVYLFVNSHKSSFTVYQGDSYLTGCLSDFRISSSGCFVLDAGRILIQIYIPSVLFKEFTDRFNIKFKR